MIEQKLDLNMSSAKYPSNSSYSQQRFEILKEFVCETIDEDGYSPRRIYEEFLAAVNEEVKWREKGYLKAKELRDMLLKYE